MTKDEAMESFNKVLYIRNLSERTINIYNHQLSKFFDWADKEDVSLIDLSTIQNYAYYLLKKGNTPSDVNVAECAIKYFYEAILGKYISRLQLPKLKYTQNEPCIFSKEEIKELLNTKDVRIKLIVLLGLDCGLRESDTRNLRICDVDTKKMTISINNSKGKKCRTVKMSNTLLEVFREYSKVYFSLREWEDDDYVFPSQCKEKKAPVSLGQVGKWFTDYVKEKNFSNDKHITYHALRHTFATNMLENGCNVFLLKKLLGHSTFSSTSRYIHYTTKDVEESFSLSDVMNFYG